MGQNQEKMIGLPIHDFMAGSEMPVDLYVKLVEGKYVCVARAGSKVDIIKELSAFETGKVDLIYIRKADYLNYVGQSLSIAEIAVDASFLNEPTKLTVLTKSLQTIETAMNEMGFSEEAFEHAKVITGAALRLIEVKSELRTLLESFQALSETAFRQSLAISLVAAMMGKSLNWQKRGTIEKLALGGLLCDVGLKELPPELIAKPRREMSFEEVTLWETHPFRGLQVLQSVKVVPDDVLACVYEHHENAIGQGFPRRLRDLRMNPLAKVMAVASQFVDLVFTKDKEEPLRTSQEAVRFIEVTMGQPFNREAFNALKKII